ncbi:hypothetical protein V5799_031679, partial [Amblyomma americanum]
TAVILCSTAFAFRSSILSLDAIPGGTKGIRCARTWKNEANTKERIKWTWLWITGKKKLSSRANTQGLAALIFMASIRRQRDPRRRCARW